MARETNWQDNHKLCFGPQVRIDCNNPQVGLNGSDVYTFYSVTDNKDQNVFGLTEGGIYKVYNDKSIEIVGGKTNNPGGVDITITSKHGDITITAEKNGQVRIRAKNITIDADENVNINAGKNVNIRAGTRFVVQANQADVGAVTGNMLPQNSSFGEKVFGGGTSTTKVNEASNLASGDKPPLPAGGASYLGKDVVQNMFFAEDISKFSSGTQAQSKSILEQLVEAGVSLLTGDGGDTGGSNCGNTGESTTENTTTPEEDVLSDANTQLTGNETAGSFAPGGAASGGALAE